MPKLEPPKRIQKFQKENSQRAQNDSRNPEVKILNIIYKNLILDQFGLFI